VKSITIILLLVLIIGCAALPKAQAPAPPENVNDRLVAIEASLPDATKKVEATAAWAEYKAAATVTDEKLKAVKELPEFKAYQRLITERAYLQKFVEPKR